MKYIKDTLGIETHTEPWELAAKLPYYLSDGYEYKKAVLDGIHCLFMKPKGELDTLTAIKKHIAKVGETGRLPVVLELTGITARRRKSLIEARIPFVASDTQIYIPFLGVALTEKFSSEKKPAEIFMPSSQLLFFHYLYQNKPELHTGGMAEKLNLSAMQITRAIRQLKALGLISVRKEGVRMVLHSKENRCDLFERSKPVLLNPVRKKVYAEYNAIPDGLPLSAVSALSEQTMLGEPPTKTFAFFGKAGDLTGTDTLVDNNTQVEIEYWKYDPVLLSQKPGIVDTLSLAVSMQTDNDPRVEQAVEQILNELWGSK